MASPMMTQKAEKSKNRLRSFVVEAAEPNAFQFNPEEARNVRAWIDGLPDDEAIAWTEAADKAIADAAARGEEEVSARVFLPEQIAKRQARLEREAQLGAVVLPGKDRLRSAKPVSELWDGRLAAFLSEEQLTGLLEDAPGPGEEATAEYAARVIKLAEWGKQHEWDRAAADKAKPTAQRTTAAEIRSRLARRGLSLSPDTEEAWADLALLWDEHKAARGSAADIQSWLEERLAKGPVLVEKLKKEAADRLLKWPTVYAVFKDVLFGHWRWRGRKVEWSLTPFPDAGPGIMTAEQMDKAVAKLSPKPAPMTREEAMAKLAANLGITPEQLLEQAKRRAGEIAEKGW